MIRPRVGAMVASAGVLSVFSILVALWLRARPLASRTVNLQAGLGAVSGFAALAGTVLLSLTVVLSARSRMVEAGVGGLDRVYRLHHLSGGAAFVLIALHPCLLAFRYAQTSWHRASHLWLPSASDTALTAGQVALWGMVLGMTVTVFARVRHQVLVWMQRVLGAMLVPAAWHVFRGFGDVSNYRPLRIFMFAVVGTGLLALVYHSVLGRATARHHHYELIQSTPLPGGVTDLRLRPIGPALRFVPGQFGFLRFSHQPIGGEAHPFSIASAPSDGQIRFLVKDLGDYTHEIGAVAPGAAAVVEGPYGRFSHRFVRGRRQVWIAGGIGIAPFLGMARSLDATTEVDLYYCVVDASAAPLLDELDALESANRRLRVRIVEERSEGFLTAEAIERRSGPLDQFEFLICGPPAMTRALRRQLSERRVRGEKIHHEDFGMS